MSPVEDPYRWGDRIEQVVRHHARMTPDAVAVQQGAVYLTFAELTQRADRIAAGLRAHRVSPGDFVPVCVHRSPDLVALLLGVLSAGAAYIAMDPEWPLQRRLQVVTSSRASLVITDADDLAWTVRAVTPSAVAAGGEPVPAASLDGRAAACVFYTSGSSGAPKGAISPHRGAIRVLVGSATVPLGPETVFLQAAPLPWDGLSLELWAPLLNGGRCVQTAPGNRPLDVAVLRDAVADGVNSLWLTSSLFHLLVEESVDLLGRLRLLLVGGERVSPSHAGTLLKRFPSVHLINGYGPAESTIFATTHVVTPADVGPGATDVPIGRPVARTTVTLLDVHGRAAPAGDAGEIAVAGDGLALGYLNDPAETERRFVTIDGVRHYLTGDLAIRDAQGLLRYRGRADRQFKVNGVRIEPEEIESVLRSHPDVADCRVARLLSLTGQPTVAALYTTPTRQPLDHSRLRAFAAQHLITAMVPSMLIWNEALPLNNNGKVDGAAVVDLLEAAASSEPVVEHTSTPDMDLEQVRRLLGAPALAATDDVFAAGASSLDAVRLAARASLMWERRVSVGDVYRLRTLDRLRADGVGSPDLRVHADGPSGMLSHSQARFWLAEASAPGEADNMVVLAYEWTGPLDARAFDAAVHDVVQRHAALRTVYSFVDGELRQQCREVGPGTVPIKWRTGTPEGLGVEDTTHFAQRITAGMWAEPFDLENEIPVRIMVHSVAAKRHLVGIHLHHISFDGWSESVLLADLVEAYTARWRGAPPQFRPSGIDVPAHADWERANLPGWLRHDLPYWRTTLARRCDPALPTPAGFGEADRAESTITVSQEDVASLRAAAVRQGGPSAAALLAVAGRAISRTFDADDVCLGTVGTGRPVPALESTIGFFVNPLVVPVGGAGSGSMHDLLRRVAGQLIEALAHDRTPFDEVVRALRPERGRHPWFQAWAVVQQRRHIYAIEPSVTVRPVRVAPPRTSIELMFEAAPNEEGGWELVVLRRTDGMSSEQAASLIGHTVEAIEELSSYHEPKESSCRGHR